MCREWSARKCNSSQLISTASETQVPIDRTSIISSSHAYPVQRIFLDWQIQQVTVSAATSGSPINIILTGLEGVTPF